MKINVGLLTLHIQFDYISSLKEKRSVVQPIITSLRRKFNVSVAEVAHQDVWNSATLAVVIVSNDTTHTIQSLQNVVKYLQGNYPRITQIDDKLEIL